MKTNNHLFLMMAVLLLATGCGKDDEPDVVIEPPVFNLQKSSAVEAVDLGLSVLWSTCNLGASSTTDYGGYFAWGDPTGALWSGEGIGYNDNVLLGTPATMAATTRRPTSVEANWMLYPCIGVMGGECPPMPR